MGVEKSCSKFGVEFGADEDAKGDDVEPKEKSDTDAKRAVDLRVVGETSDIPAEGDRGDEPHKSRDDRSRKGAFPGLLHGTAQVVDEGSQTDAAG
jgi:hypothetical protein